MARLRLALVGAVLLSTACSFLDDFDRFKTRAADAGEFDAGPDEPPDAEPLDEEDTGTQDGDGATTDAATLEGDGALPDDGGADAGDGALPPGDLACRGRPDGVSCGEGQLICRQGFCRTSRCGDTFIDRARNEQCDDGNLVAGDGCEPSSCLFSCENDGRCDNAFPCDGEERCDVTNHRCMPDSAPGTGLSCERDMRSGTCNDKGYCLTPGCGDGVVGGGEQCDPAQASPPPGCRADCTLGCTNDAACADDDMCNGSETCDLGSATCRPGTRLTCMDGDACSQDGACDARLGCTYALIDADGDQVSEATCSAGSRFTGGDCDGSNAAIYPGATEYCDGVDNDCDGTRDEGAVMAICYPDADGDGFPLRQGEVMRCVCGAGTRVARSDGLWDCNDDPRRGGADVYPGQSAFFGVGHEIPCAGGNGSCVSFDYNCDTTETGQYGPGTGTCGAVLGLNCAGGGFNGAPPACGQEAAYLVCASGNILACQSRSERRRQLCR